MRPDSISRVAACRLAGVAGWRSASWNSAASRLARAAIARQPLQSHRNPRAGMCSLGSRACARDVAELFREGPFLAPDLSTAVRNEPRASGMDVPISPLSGGDKSDAIPDNAGPLISDIPDAISDGISDG